MTLKIDHFLTLHLFHRWVGSRPRKGLRLPILMYHSICDEPENGHPHFWINTSPGRFLEQMALLAQEGWKVISLEEVSALLQNRSMPSSSRAVVITFDDGFRDFYTKAHPILDRFGFKATVFLPTGRIGKKEPGIRGKAHLDWNEVRELHSRGIRFGSHTVNHLPLEDLEEGMIDFEVRRSKEMIEDKIGEEVTSFSCPYRFPEPNGALIDRLRNSLRQAGYQTGVSTKIGTVGIGEDRFSLSRLPVSTGDDPEIFRAKLEGAYDWVHSLQRRYKAFRKWFSQSHV